MSKLTFRRRWEAVRVTLLLLHRKDTTYKNISSANSSRHSSAWFVLAVGREATIRLEPGSALV